MLSIKTAEKLLLLAVTIIVLGCLFPSDSKPFTWLEPYSLELMWLLLSGGFLLFFSNRSRLAFIALGGCAVICYVLNERTGASIKAPEKTEDAFSMRAGIFRLSFPDPDLNSTLDAITTTGVDFMTLQNVQASQYKGVRKFLRQAGYHYFQDAPFGSDSLKMVLCSKHPIDFAQVTPQQKAPVIFGRLRLWDSDSLQSLHIVSTVFPLESPTEETARLIDKLAHQLERIEEPNLILCDLNLLPWSRHLQAFKSSSSVEDSRRGVRPASEQGNLTIFERPTDHIFYSKHFKCISFETISYGPAAHIGIVGTFQLVNKGRFSHVRQTSQKL